MADALGVLNQALHAHRMAAADPYASEVARAAALVTRVGYGTGEQVADGRWSGGSRARAADAPAGGRRAAALRRRSASPPCCPGATSRSRARCSRCGRGSTSTTGREREAALQLRAALEAALAELAAGATSAGSPAGSTSCAACSPAWRPPPARRCGRSRAEDAERVRTALGRLEAALRARSAAT